MSRFLVVLIVFSLVTYSVDAETRTWTSKSGKTVEGEYVNAALEKVTIKDANGDLIQLPLDQLCDEDLAYVEIKNPPVLTIDYRESIKPNKITADNWIDNGGGSHANHEVTVCEAQFGALIKQTSSEPYDHELTVEIYIFTHQYLDPDNYRLIGHSKSQPFKLTKENKFRYVYTDPNDYRIIYYNLYSTRPRGERPSKYLILVRDERGEIVTHEARSEWLYKYLDRLEKLPVGAWLNDKCIRIHPTSPERGS